jgi:hypothetical protein
MDKKFNYCVASYWREDIAPEHAEWAVKQYGDSIGVYAYGSEHFYGTLKEAKKFKKHVEKKSPDKNWHIFQIVEVPE